MLILVANGPLRNMELSPLSERYLFIFFLLGHSSFNPYASKSGLWNKLNAIPSTIFLIVSTVLSVFSLVFQYLFDKFHTRTVDKVISCLFIVSAFVSCIAILMRSALFNKKIPNLWYKFQVIEEFANRRRRQKMCFRPFIQSFFRKVCIILAFYILHVYVKVVYRFSSNDMVNKTSVLTLQFITLISILHVAFYVDLLTYIVAAINENVNFAFQREIFDLSNWNMKNVMENFRLYKHAHYLMWDISQFINQHFGWVLLSLLLQNFINIIYSAYWAILFLHTDDVTDNQRILRK